MPLTETKSARQLSDGNTVGTLLGQSASDNIGFYRNDAGVPQILQGSLAGIVGTLRVYATSQSPASVASNSTAEASMTVTGVAATDMVVAVVKPTAQAGLAVGTARTSTTNTIAASFGNLTGAAITPTTTETYYVVTASANLQYPAITISPAAVAANTTVEQQFTVTGVQVGMAVAVNKPTLQAGLLVTGARVVAANTIGITFMNVTASTITPTASEAYSVFAAQGVRPAPVMENISVTLSPNSVAANTTAEQTFTVTGLTASTAVEVIKPSVTPGIALVGARVSAANTLALTFGNVTAAAITPPTETYTVSYYPQTAPSAGSSNTTTSALGIDAAKALQYVNLISAGELSP